MNIAFYTSASGMTAFQGDMDRIAHNMANVNTTGYKTTRSVFSDLLYSRMAVNVEQEFLVGHGVKADDKDLIFTQGAVIPTNNPMDFGILGDGFFGVEDAEGNRQYSRNGAFYISVEDESVVTGDGYYVLDSDGSPITLERDQNSNQFILDDLASRIGIFRFENPYGLEQASGGRYLETEKSGEAIEPGYMDDGAYTLVQSALESSSVDVSQEMVSVITTQKAFQFSARLVQTADNLEEIVNNLR